MEKIFARGVRKLERRYKDFLRLNDDSFLYAKTIEEIASFFVISEGTIYRYKRGGAMRLKKRGKGYDLTECIYEIGIFMGMSSKQIKRALFECEIKAGLSLGLFRLGGRINVKKDALDIASYFSDNQ